MPELPKVEVSSKLPKVDAVVVGVLEDAGTAHVQLPPALGQAWAKWQAPDHRGQGDLGTASVVPGPGGVAVIVVGLGDQVTPESVRLAAGHGVRLARRGGLSHVAIALPADEPELAIAAADGATLGGYAPHRLTKEPDDRPRTKKITVLTAVDSVAIDEAMVVTAAVARARDWVNLPANLLYPETFAEQARQVAKGTKITVQVLDDKQLAAEGYGGLTAVGGGSSRGPRLVRMSYAPRGANTHLALVGKGITFDSGGLDIKTQEGMYTMKCDMAGAAAVLSAVRAIADLGLKVRVTAYAPMAENMPSGTAYRPSDVLTMYGGLTVENANTDAEGRLVMADALARAAEDAPDAVVDVATLTGACMVALGKSTAGLLSDDDGLADTILGASESVGEPFWRLPLHAEAQQALKSSIADVRSSGSSRYGGALVAGAFLRRFVPEAISWAHLDIAGPAWRDESDSGADTGGGTGFGVRTLVGLARSMAQ